MRARTLLVCRARTREGARSIRSALAALAGVVCVLSVQGSVLACPVCHSELGEQVRATIFGADFGIHLLAILTPFPFFAAIAIGLGNIFSRRASREPGRADGDERASCTAVTAQKEQRT